MITQSKWLSDKGYDTHIVSEAILRDGVNYLALSQFKRRVIPGDILIYHYCDVWEAGERVWLESPGIRIFRYHNNTPWYFFSRYSRMVAFESLQGMLGVQNLIQTNKVDRYWANSQFTIKQLLALGAPIFGCDVVYPFPIRGHDFDVIEPDRNIIQKYQGKKLILFVGRMVPHKGHKYFLEVLKRIRDSDPNVYGVTIGRPNDYMVGYLKELEVLRDRLDLRNHIEFLPEITDSELKAFYTISKILLYLSEHEGFGLPIIEAIRQDVAVIAGNTSAISTDLSKVVSLYIPTDYNSIAKEALHLLGDEDYLMMRLRVQQSGAIGLSIEEMGNELEKKIGQAINRNDQETRDEENQNILRSDAGICFPPSLMAARELLQGQENPVSSTDLNAIEVVSLNRKYGWLINSLRKIIVKVFQPLLVKQYRWTLELQSGLKNLEDKITELEREIKSR